MARVSDLIPIGEVEAEPAAGPAGWTAALWGDAVLAGLLALIAVAILGVAAATAYLAIPYADAHDWIFRVFALEQSHDWLGYLWEPHTNQRIPIARLVQAVDIDGVRGRAPSFLLASAATMLLGAGALATLLARSRISIRLKLWLGCAAALLLTNVALAEDFAFPVFSVYLFVAGPALAAVCFFQLSAQAGLRSGAFWAALLCATLASLGNAAGLAVWPTLAILAVMQERRRSQIAVLIAVAVAVGLGIEAGLGAPSSSLGAGTGSPVDHLAKMIAYFAAFGALPWSRAVHPTMAATALGVVVWALAAWTLLKTRFWRQDAAAPLTQAGAGLILFAALTALLAAVGRVDELPEPIVPTRYSPFAMLLQLGIVLGSTRRLEALQLRGRWWAPGLAIGMAVVILASDIHGARKLAQTADRIRAASVLFDQGGVPTSFVIHPRPAFARSVRQTLKERGLPY